MMTHNPFATADTVDSSLPPSSHNPFASPHLASNALTFPSAAPPQFNPFAAPAEAERDREEAGEYEEQPIQSPLQALTDFYASAALATPSSSIPPTAAHLSTTSTTSTPLFRLEREESIRLSSLPSPPNKEAVAAAPAFLSMAIGQGTLLVATSHGQVLRTSLSASSATSGMASLSLTSSPSVEVITISKKADEVLRHVFLDPFGNHALLTFASGNNFYLHRKWQKPHALSKWKNLVVESVAWNSLQGDEKSTSKFLVGSSRGLIYECILDEKDKERPPKKLFDLNEGQGEPWLGQAGPIQGLSMEMFPPEHDDEPITWLVIAATPSRQYQFVGGPRLEQVFQGTNSSPRFQELPGAFAHTELRFFSKKATAAAPVDEPPSLCAWLTGAGIYYGDLNWKARTGDVIENGKLLAYPEDPITKQPIPPVSLICTEFHFLLLTKNELIAINALSEEIVHEVSIDSKSMGEPRCLAYDHIKLTIWLLTSKAVYEVIVEGEDREVWRLYLQEGDYDAAYEYCDNDEQRELVTEAHAQYLIANQHFRLAAEKLAKTKRPFEEVALEFVHLASTSHAWSTVPSSTTNGGSTSVLPSASALALEAKSALKIYLLGKLHDLPASALTQQTMICTWLTEIYLDNLNNLADSASTSDQPSLSSSAATPVLTFLPFTSESPVANGDDALMPPHSNRATSSLSSINDRSLDDPYAVLTADERHDLYVTELQEFHAFMKEFSDCLNKSTTIDMLSSYQRLDVWLDFAKDDLDWLLTYRLQHAQFDEALQTLASHPQPLKILDAIVKFAPALIHERPRATVDLFIATKGLDPAKLIPALMRYDEDNAQVPSSEAIRFLEHCVYKLRNREPIVHNYLIALYARQGDSVPLLRFLESQRGVSGPPAGTNAGTAASHNTGPVFDAQYALRLCYEHNAQQACVAIYSIMNLHEQAVNSAIAFDIPLAKRVIAQAQLPSEDNLGQSGLDPLTAKRLWLLVARAIIARHADDIPQTMALLKDCGSLNLEDLLPFFPDTIRIGQLKDEIARSLDAYNKEIETLKANMEASSKAAQEIRDDLATLKSRSASIPSNRKCDLCGLMALNAPFYLFPSCLHVLHIDCAKKDIVAYWDRYPTIKRKIVSERVALEKEKQAQAVAARQAQLNAGIKHLSSVSVMPQIDAIFHPTSSQLQARNAYPAATQSADEWSNLSKAAKEQRILDDFSAHECCLCGVIAIDSVNQPYVALNDEDDQRLIALWSI